MPSKVVCFWLEPTSLVEVSFRRFCSVSALTCPFERVPYSGHPPVVWGYHNAEIKLETCERTRAENGGDLPTVEQQADPRWPKKCGCGYVFSPTDHWQINTQTIYLIANNQVTCTLHDAPAGAMYDAHWYKDRKGPDGKSVVLKTPAGEWWINGPANNGPGWTRTGTVPIISCTPSIQIGGTHPMHGWLRNGVLEIDSP